MESIYFLTLIVVTFVTQAFSEKERSMKIAAPTFVELTALEGTGPEDAVKVTWNPVDHKDVVGYKVKVWVVGERVNMSKEEMVLENPKLYENPPQFEIVTSKNETKAVFNDIKLGKIYAFRVAAYTDKEEGPLSTAYGIEIHSEPVPS